MSCCLSAWIGGLNSSTMRCSTGPDPKGVVEADGILSYLEVIHIFILREFML